MLSFGVNGTYKTKAGIQGRNPASKKILGRILFNEKVRHSLMLELLFSLNNTKVQKNERIFDSNLNEQHNIYSRRTHKMEKYICTYTGQQNLVLPLLLHVLRGMCGWVDGWMGVWVGGCVGMSAF